MVYLSHLEDENFEIGKNKASPTYGKQEALSNLKEMEKNTGQDIMAKTVCGILQKMLAAMPGADFTEIYTFIKKQAKRP